MANLTQQAFANPTTSYFVRTTDASNVASNWANFPATSAVNVSFFPIQNVSGIYFGSNILNGDNQHLFYNGQTLVNASDLQNITDWALYPAIANIDANNNNISNVNSIELNTETITATPTAVLTNGLDQTRNWALFSATQSVNLSGNSITNLTNINSISYIPTQQWASTPATQSVNLSGNSITNLTNINSISYIPTQQWASTPATQSINLSGNSISNLTNINSISYIPTQQWASTPATQSVNLSGNSISNLTNINNVSYVPTQQWSSTPATQSLDLSQNSISNAQNITGSVLGGLVLSNVAQIKPRPAGMTIGTTPQSWTTDELNTRRIFAGDPAIGNGYIELNGNLQALSTIGGHTIGNVPVAGVYTNRMDFYTLGGISMFSPLFITMNAAAALNITGAGALAIAGNVITLDHDPATSVRIKGTASAQGKLTFPNGGNIEGVNNYDGFSATLNSIQNRLPSTTLEMTANTFNIHGTQILLPPSYSNAQINLQGSLTATQLITASSATITNEINVSGVPVYQTITTRTQNVIYVAKSGNDANPGSILLPKQTIQSAITLAESLNPTATTQIVIEVAPGQYAENLTFTKGYVALRGYSTFSDMNEIIEITGTITINITTGADDLFNRQVIIQGMSITGSITDTSTIKHSLALTSCRLYGTNRLFYQNSSVDNRTYLDDLTISQQTLTANTDPLIQINIGTLYIERMNASILNNCSVLSINGTAIVGRMFNTTLESTTTSTTAAPVMVITSTTLSPHSIGTTSFTYTSLANKTGSATSCGILFNTTANANASVQYCSFVLAGTADPANHAIAKQAGSTGTPTLGFFSCACFYASKIQAGITKVAGTALN